MTEKNLSLEECIDLARIVPERFWKKQIVDYSPLYTSRFNQLNIKVWIERDPFVSRYDNYGIMISSKKLNLGEYEYYGEKGKGKKYQALSEVYKEIAKKHRDYRKRGGSLKNPEMQTALSKARDLLGRK